MTEDILGGILGLTGSYPKPAVVVVRLKTCHYTSRRGIHCRQDLQFMAKCSDGYNWLVDEAQMCGTDLVFSRITNLHECEDGLYEVHTCNESRDWETGTIDEYDFVLVPYKTPTEGWADKVAKEICDATNKAVESGNLPKVY